MTTIRNEEYENGTLARAYLIDSVANTISLEEGGSIKWSRAMTTAEAARHLPVQPVASAEERLAQAKAVLAQVEAIEAPVAPIDVAEVLIQLREVL